MSDVIVRPATHADYTEVLAINKDIYDGFDYLPQVYYWLLHTQDNYPYVGTLGGKVVGFANYYIIDNGRTIYTGALRVANSYQGRGINQTITDHMTKEIRAKYPNIDAEAEIMIQNDGGDRRLVKMAYQTEYTWHIMRYLADSNALMTAVEQMGIPEHSTQLSMSQAFTEMPEIKEIINKHTNNIVCTLFSFWCASRDTTFADLRKIIMANNVMTSYKATDGERHLTAVSFMATQANGEDVKPRANIFFYGDSVDDLIDHLKLCLRKLASVTSAADGHRTGLFVHFPKTCPVQPVMQFLPDVLKPIHPPGRPDTGILAYRRL